MKMNKAGKAVLYFVPVILGLYFTFKGLKEAKPFLSPLVIAFLLSTMILPAAKKFEKWGLSRGWASFLSDLLIVAAAFGFFLLIMSQVQILIEDWPGISRRIEPHINRIIQHVENKPLSVSRTPLNHLEESVESRLEEILPRAAAMIVHTFYLND
jgi:predicted PurR-regulated permease PerM